MATRTPATAAEITEVLRSTQAHQGWAVPYHSLIVQMRRALHTRTPSAAAWLLLALKDESREFELIKTSAGSISAVWRPEGYVALHRSGYTKSMNADAWPQLSWQGAPESSDPVDGERQFVVLVDDLRNMCRVAADRARERQAARQSEQDAAVDRAEQRHGDALAYVRGLLKMAGIEISADSYNAKYRERSDFTSLNLTLMDADIDSLGDVLAAHGIEPDPPVRVVTRKTVASSN